MRVYILYVVQYIVFVEMGVLRVVVWSGGAGDRHQTAQCNGRFLNYFTILFIEGAVAHALDFIHVFAVAGNLTLLEYSEL